MSVSRVAANEQDDELTRTAVIQGCGAVDSDVGRGNPKLKLASWLLTSRVVHLFSRLLSATAALTPAPRLYTNTEPSSVILGHQLASKLSPSTSAFEFSLPSRLLVQQQRTYNSVLAPRPAALSSSLSPLPQMGNNNPLPVALPQECRKAAKLFSAFVDRTYLPSRARALAQLPCSYSQEGPRFGYPSRHSPASQGFRLPHRRQGWFRPLCPRGIWCGHRQAAGRQLECAERGRHRGRWIRLSSRSRDGRVLDHSQVSPGQETLLFGAQPMPCKLTSAPTALAPRSLRSWPLDL